MQAVHVVGIEAQSTGGAGGAPRVGGGETSGAGPRVGGGGPGGGQSDTWAPGFCAHHWAMVRSALHDRHCAENAMQHPGLCAFVRAAIAKSSATRMAVSALQAGTGEGGTLR